MSIKFAWNKAHKALLTYSDFLEFLFWLLSEFLIYFSEILVLCTVSETLVRNIDLRWVNSLRCQMCWQIIKCVDNLSKVLTNDQMCWHVQMCCHFFGLLKKQDIWTWTVILAIKVQQISWVWIVASIVENQNGVTFTRWHSFGSWHSCGSCRACSGCCRRGQNQGSPCNWLIQVILTKVLEQTLFTLMSTHIEMRRLQSK